MELRTITGTLSTWGNNESDPSGKARKYDYVRFKPGDGSDGYVERVIAVAVMDSFLRMDGDIRTYYFAPLKLPRMFGSHRYNVLYAVRDQGRLNDAISKSVSYVAVGKVEALRAFVVGTVMLIIPPIGITLWIWGLRTLGMGLPTARMREELRRPVF